MPASAHRAVQTDAHDGRKFITFRVASNGRVAYRKVYLLTKNGLVARRRAKVIDDLEDVEEARAVIKYLADSSSLDVEKRRLAELSGNQPLIPAMTVEEARAELETVVCDFGKYAKGEIPDEVVDDWRLEYVPEKQKEMLIDLGVPKDYLDDAPSVFTDIRPRTRKINPDFRPRWKAQELLWGRRLGPLAKDRPARGPRLSECIKEFETEQAQRGNIARHRSAYVKRFQVLVDFLKDKHIRALDKQDFVKFVDHVLALKSGLSNKTIKDYLTAIEAVLECARVRMDDDVFPEGIDNWLRIIDREKRKRPYKPDLKNREPMPPGVFKALLRQADEWAERDWEAHAASLPVPDELDRRRRALAVNRNKQMAQYEKRVGLVTHSMLCLAANVGAQPIDFTRLQWDELVLDGDLPLYRESRTKPSHLLGGDVPRCCPLLPETVRSLKRWRRWQQAELAQAAAREAAKRKPGGNGALTSLHVDAMRPHPTNGSPAGARPSPIQPDRVFTYADGRPMDQEKSFQVSTYLLKLRKAAGCTDWEVRHCRNIGSTVRRNAGLPSDMADAWLGHSARETNRFYTGEADVDYLLPLVEEIGRRYFNLA